MGNNTPATTTVKQETQVDPTTSAWKNAVFGQASNLYNQGAPAYYPGSTVTPYSDQTWQGLDMLQSQAQGGVPNLSAAYGANARALSGNTPGMDTAQSAASGQMANPYTQQITQASQVQVAPQMQQALSGINNPNPYLDATFNSGASKIRDQMNATFAGAGRTGPNAAFGQGFGNALGDFANQVYMPAYENNMNRQLQAAGMYGDTLNSDANRQYQGASDLAGLGEAGFNRQLSGAQLAGGLNSQANADAATAAGQLGGLYSAGSAPANSMLGVGAAYENLGTEYNQADQARYNYNANAPWNFLGQYANMVNGLPVSQSSTQTQQGAATNRGMAALGGAATGFGAAGPWGALLGGLGGYALS